MARRESGGRHSSLTHADTWQTSCEASSPKLIALGAGSPTPLPSGSALLLPRLGTGLAFLSAAAAEGHRQLSHSEDLGTSSSACSARGKVGGISPSPMSLLGRQLAGPALPCKCPWGWACHQGQFYCAAQVMCRACSSQWCSW